MKILHVTYGFNGGGVGFVIANYCTRQALDGIEFDIVGEDQGHKQLLHDRFEAAGFGVHYVTPKGKSLPRNIYQMYRLMKNGRYDGVHVHFEEWSFLYLLLARLCKIPVRICHAHMAYMPGTEKKPHYRLFRALLNALATERLACSQDAGAHLYGAHPFRVLRNAIDAGEYRYDPLVRASMRKALGVEGRCVVGVVGRLSYQKNPEMSVEILREMRRVRQDVVLVMVGAGELEEKVRALIAQWKMEDAVLLLGLRRDVPALLQAMDAFVLPSRWEGLGMVYVEAQAAGLMTFGTADVVPREAAVCPELMHFVPRESTAAQWAEAVLAAWPYARRETTAQIARAGYDLKDAVKGLESIYHGERKTGSA